eukprot:gene11098-12931_t
MSLRISNKLKIKTGQPLRATTSLNIPLLKQEQTNWCWAACATMISRYYGHSAVTQCSCANLRLGQSSCCQIPSSALCNVGASDPEVTRLFRLLNLKSAYQASTLSFGLLVVETGSGRPVEVGYTWRNQGTQQGGGHVAVVIGTATINNKQVVEVNDPAYGKVSVLYADLLTAYNLGNWDATWTGIQELRLSN